MHTANSHSSLESTINTITCHSVNIHQSFTYNRFKTQTKSEAKNEVATRSHNLHMQIDNARIERKRNGTVAGRRRGRGLGLALRVGGEHEGDECQQPHREPRRDRHFLLQRTHAGAATIDGGGASPARVKRKSSRGRGKAVFLGAAVAEGLGRRDRPTAKRAAGWGPRVRQLRRGSSHTCLSFDGCDWVLVLLANWGVLSRVINWCGIRFGR